MSIWTRPLALFGFARAAAETPSGVMPQLRYRAESYVSTDSALSLSTVYRSVQIDATSICQLSVNVEQRGVIMSSTPALIAQPDQSESRSAFLEYVAMSLKLDGNAFWKLTRADLTSRTPGAVVNIEPVNPTEVHVARDPQTDAITYSYRGVGYTKRDMMHLKYLRVPGMDRGLGPIQAAQTELRGAISARDYGSMWLDQSSTPDGVLSTDQVLQPGQGDQFKNVWYGRNPDGTAKDAAAQFAATERLRVLGQGLSYTPLMLKPADVQFLETQQFTTTQIARLMGTPASLLLAAVEGNSMTYSNVEQEWIAYVRFSLMKILREIEEAFTLLLPRGQVARFNIAALLRTDTKTRIETHAVAIKAGIYDEDEARAIEGYAPRTAEQIAAALARTPAAIAPLEATK